MRLPTPATPGLALQGTTEVVDVRLRASGRALVTIRSTLEAGEELILEQTGELVVKQRERTHWASP
jgi:acyl dehydratase